MPRAIFSDLSKIGRPIPTDVSILQCLRIKNGLAEFIPGSPGSPGSRLSAQSGARAAVPNPTSRAGGQDDVSLEQTPSNYIIISLYHYMILLVDYYVIILL